MQIRISVMQFVSLCEGLAMCRLTGRLNKAVMDWVMRSPRVWARRRYRTVLPS